MRSWKEIRRELVVQMSDDARTRWEKSLAQARKRYRNEIRKHRGIPRVRKQYRAKTTAKRRRR